MNYKGYVIEKAVYLHDEESAAKYFIVEDGIIVAGAGSVSEAKKRIDDEEIDVVFTW